jgi:hypothetical protein
MTNRFSMVRRNQVGRRSVFCRLPSGPSKKADDKTDRLPHRIWRWLLTEAVARFRRWRRASARRPELTSQPGDLTID